MIDPEDKEKIKAAAAATVGATVGGAGGATAGVLELAARQAATVGTAGLVIGIGAVAGGFLSFMGFKLYRRLREKKS